jgi:hypothetical protein
MTWCKNIFIWGVGFLSGILLFYIPKLQFSYEIKLVDLVSICVTLTIAFLIQLYLVRKSDINKIEKDMIIEQAKKVRDRFENVRDIFYDLYVSQAAATDRNKRILSVLKSLANSLETFEHSFTLARGQFVQPRCRRLRTIYYAYKKELTTLNPRQPYTEKTFQAAEAIFNDASRELISIMLYVNQN